MKNRLNITVDDLLMQRPKHHAAKHQTCVSQLIEQYFKNLTRTSRSKNIIQLVEQLPKPAINNNNTNLKEAYYNDQQKKHGF